MISSGPATASDGTIYYITGVGDLLAIGRQGTEKWSYPLLRHGQFRGVTIPNSVRSLIGPTTIDANGNIYIGIGNTLLSLTDTGQKRWTLNIPDAKSSITIGADGTLYFMCSTDLCAVGDVNSRLNWPVNIRMYCRPIVTDIAKFALEHAYGYTEKGYPSLTLSRYDNPYDWRIDAPYRNGQCIKSDQWPSYENKYLTYASLRRESSQDRARYSYGVNLDLAFPLKGIDGISKSIFDPPPQIGGWPTCKDDIVTLCSLKNIDESQFPFIYLGFMSDDLVKLFGTDGLGTGNETPQYREQLPKRLPSFLAQISMSAQILEELQNTGLTGDKLARHFYAEHEDTWVEWFSDSETNRVNKIRVAATSARTTGTTRTSTGLPVVIPVPVPKPIRPLCSAEMKSQFHIMYGKAHGFKISVWIDDIERIETKSGGGGIDTGRPYIIKIPVCDELGRSLVGKVFYIKMDGAWSSATDLIKPGIVVSMDIQKPIFISAGPTITPAPTILSSEWNPNIAPTPWPTATPAPIPTSGWFTIPPRKKNPNLISAEEDAYSLHYLQLNYINMAINETAVHPGFYYLPNWESLSGASRSYDPESAHRYLHQAYGKYQKPGVCVVALTDDMNQHISEIEKQLKDVGFRKDPPECITIYLVSVPS